MAGGGAGAAAGGASVDSLPAAAVRPTFFCFLDFFEGGCALAYTTSCSASSFSIDASTRTAFVACSTCIASLHRGGRLGQRCMLPDEICGRPCGPTWSQRTTNKLGRRLRRAVRCVCLVDVGRGSVYV